MAGSFHIFKIGDIKNIKNKITCRS